MNKIYLLTLTRAYSYDLMERKNEAFLKQEDAIKEFNRWKEIELHSLLDRYDLESFDELEGEYIDINNDTETYFNYLSIDGTEELELQVEELEVK